MSGSGSACRSANARSPPNDRDLARPAFLAAAQRFARILAELSTIISTKPCQMRKTVGKRNRSNGGGSIGRLQVGSRRLEPQAPQKLRRCRAAMVAKAEFE